uniref:Immunoglobulin V-set domain-containing protein n=1 Tax=Chrysemys picta bellii TaxID=8478 RepID=A0A8C3J192_CHRPI
MWARAISQTPGIELAVASGPLGGELTVQCWYGRGYENYIKYWCRGTTWTSCLIVVTTGSEAIVKHDRVSIKDIHTFCTFIVTMKNLTEKDSGTYWCGIDKLGLDLMFSVKVNVLPGKSRRCPPAVSGLPGLGQGRGGTGELHIPAWLLVTGLSLTLYDGNSQRDLIIRSLHTLNQKLRSEL